MQKINQINNNTHADYLNSNAKANNSISTKDTFTKNSSPKMLNLPSLKASAKTLGLSSKINQLEKLWEYKTKNEYIGSSPPYLSKDKKNLFIGTDDGIVYALDITSGNIKWKFKAEGKIDESTFSDNDETLYVGSTDGYKNSNLYAIDKKTKKEKWKTEIKGHFCGSLLISPDEILYVITNKSPGECTNNNIYAIDTKSGTAKLIFETKESLKSSGIITSDGKTIFMQDWKSNLYAIDTKDGKEKWKTPVDTGAYSLPPPRFSPDEKFLFICNNNNNEALSVIDAKTGKIEWNFKVAEKNFNYFCLSHDGKTAFLGSSSGKIYTIDTTLKKPTRDFPTGAYIHSPICPSVDGETIFVGSGDNKFFAIDAKSGKQKWKSEIKGLGVYSSIMLSPDGKILFVGNSDSNDDQEKNRGEIYAIDTASGVIRGKFQAGNEIYSPFSISADGKIVFVNDSKGIVYALKFKPDEEIVGEIKQDINKHVGDNKIVKGTDSVKIGNVTLPVNQRYQKI